MIRIEYDGKVRVFSGEADLGEYYAEPVKQRASHVEPVRLSLRALFHLIRWLVSDDSRAAEWTRRWPCLWRVRMLTREQIGLCFCNIRYIYEPFPCRADAIQAERRIIMTGETP
jgi:hypothetical protein